MAKSPRRQPSTIDKLPEEVRALIGELRERRGFTIDEIIAHLRQLDIPGVSEISRSAIGRHVKGLREIGEQIRRAREISNAIVDHYGQADDNKAFRLNLELMHSIVLRTATAVQEDEETGEARPMTFSPEDVRFLSQSLSALASAQKTDADRYAKAKAEAAREAAARVDAGVAKRLGWSAETARQVRAEILGVKPAAA